MLKLKLVALVVIFVFVGIVLNGSHQFSTSAKTDVLADISNYKSWTKITSEPIKVSFWVDGQIANENIFIIDGQETTNFRTGALNG